MRYRPLGDTGVQVSEIGFGAWGIGGSERAPAYGSTDDRISIDALEQAFELGVNFFDTSDLYGDGHSEVLIGQTFKDVRSKVVIATKVGMLDESGTQDFTPDHIKKSLNASLNRLQTDYIDLYQLHSPTIELLERDDTILSTLYDLKRDGAVRTLGISLASPRDGLAAVSRFGFQSVQVNFSLMDQRALELGLIDLCASRDAGIIARTPLSYGFLSGAYAPDTKFQSNDHRSQRSRDQINKWASAHSLFAQAFPEEHNQTRAQLALRFCLSYGPVSTVIPGMLNRSEVLENVVAGDSGSFSQDTLDCLEGIYKANDFFIGG